MGNIWFSGNLSEINNYDNFCNTCNKVIALFNSHFNYVTKYKLFIDNATAGSGHTPIITPIFKEYLIIKLGVVDFENSAEIAFEFAHEYMHYLFYTYLGINKPRASGEEETICTAVSLYVVNELFPGCTNAFYTKTINSPTQCYKDGAQFAFDTKFSIDCIKERVSELVSAESRNVELKTG